MRTLGPFPKHEIIWIKIHRFGGRIQLATPLRENFEPRNVDDRPIELFLCLFQLTLFEDIAYQTNLYAMQTSQRKSLLFQRMLIKLKYFSQ